MPTYRIELLTRAGDYRGPYTATGPDMFEALVRLRRQLEPEGIMVAVQGARRDTFPSGMQRDMAGGQTVYVLTPGRKGSSEATEDTLADAPIDQLATVDDQHAHWQAWLAEPGKE